MEELKAKAHAAGLWNLFLPDISGLSLLEYGVLASVMVCGLHTLSPRASVLPCMYCLLNGALH